MRKINGFTIIEMVVALGIFATLTAIGYIRSVDIERRAPIGALSDTVIADLRGQQTKAMAGDLGVNHGIHFQFNEYTLFKGAAYNALDPSNAVTVLPTNITFSSVTFPDASVIFSKGSGDIAGFTAGNNTVTITQTLTGESKTVSINQYGAVTSVQ